VRVVKGAFVGLSVTPHQFCNDWVMVKEWPKEEFSPLMLRLESAEEHDFFRNDPEPGVFWDLFDIARDGCFVRKVTR